MKTRTVKGIEHHLYADVAEFRDYHLSTALVLDWRHSNRGDWVLCDDGQVCQVLHLGIMKSHNRKKETTFIRTIIGSFICGEKSKMQGEMRTNMHTFSLKGKSPSVRRRERKNATNSKLLLRTERVKNLIRDEINKHLEEAEITPKYLLEEMRDVIDKSESTDRDKITALTTLMKISGMMDTEKKSESLTVFQGFTQEQLNAIQKPKHKKLQEVKRDIKN